MSRLDSFFGDKFHKRVFFICLIISIVLLIASFLLPPMGIIEPSVLAGTGELFAFATLGSIVAAVERGKKATLSKGSINLSIGDDKKEEDTE